MEVLSTASVTKQCCSLSSSCFFAWFWPTRLPVTLPICSGSCGAGAQLAAAGPKQWGFRLWLVLSELWTFVTRGTVTPQHLGTISSPTPDWEALQVYELLRLFSFFFLSFFLLIFPLNSSFSIVFETLTEKSMHNQLFKKW